MQLGVLFPLVAGVVVVLALVAVMVVLRRVSPSRAADGPGDLTSADWTGESATGDPASAVPTRVANVAPHRLTVAEAVAAREADTAPLPVLSVPDAGALDLAPSDGATPPAPADPSPQP